MLVVARYFVVLVTLVTFCATSEAHVVIDDFATGNTGIDGRSAGVQVGKARATGEISTSGGRRSNKAGFSYKPNSNEKPSQNSRKSAARRTPFLNNSKSKGRAGGGSGGGSRRNRRASQNGKGDGYSQPIVIIKDSTVRNSDIGVNVNVLSPRSGGNAVGRGNSAGSGSTGSTSSPGGGDGGEGDREEDGDQISGTGAGTGTGTGSQKVSGTPEPTGFVIWALAGCCGYGVLRFRPRRSEEARQSEEISR